MKHLQKVASRFVTLLIAVFSFLAVGAQPQIGGPKTTLKPKPQKEIPRFPPQFHSRDTIGAAQRKADSIAKAKLKATAIKKMQTDNYEQPDTVIKIVKQTEDINGNVTIEREVRVGRRTYFQTIVRPGMLNRKFSMDTINKDSITMQVIKKANRLYVYHKGRFLTSYKCVFGPDPYTQKVKEGDKRTPEGWFKILEMRPHAEWVFFMLLDYPNEESYKNFQANKANGFVLGGERIGGSIGIHGVWPGGDDFIERKKNWTDGCIALTRADIAELYKVCKVGTPICIKLRADSPTPKRPVSK